MTAEEEFWEAFKDKLDKYFTPLQIDVVLQSARDSLEEHYCTIYAP